MVEPLDSVRAQYSARASEYIAALGSIQQVSPVDLAFIETWARNLDGLVLDVGCGPGHWTHFLTSLGLTVEGIDPVPEFINSARATYPGVRFRVGRGDDLDVADGSLGGVFAWYSLIHVHPGAALLEFARCLRPGGGLALGFFTGPQLAPFDHAITTAYYWPVDLLTAEVEAAGFTVTQCETRTDPGSRPHGAILAIRS
ncbi:hypothetical protein CATRI_00165 [Corynebacterium atrinae]|uniref:class I SAM-dependent methyltransferase n=1 Tax=Corynebacterium atrinae TaxID=1336740 RepID=UPI0025B2BB35|nr:class I SAM-dependent methyltransferase [Corynebacterium atrinae]WJY62156.1 hypothetical protein CATRI_00165 [Corynebacterium atrinae]